jgi:hypothetical protein
MVTAAQPPYGVGESLWRLERRWRLGGGGRRQAVRVKRMSSESDRQTMADVKSLEQAVEALDPLGLGGVQALVCGIRCSRLGPPA